MVKLDPNGVMSNWGIAPPTAAPTLNTSSQSGPLQDILQLESFDSLTGWTTINATRVLDTANFQEGTGSIEMLVARLRRGLMRKNITINLNQFASQAWQALHAYFANASEPWLGDRIFDSNNNVQVCTTSGTSGAAPPVWKTNIGDTTNDGTVVWTMYGPQKSSTGDVIKLWIGTDEPNNLELIEMDFVLNAAATDYYRYQIPLNASSFVPNAGGSQVGASGSQQPGAGLGVATALGGGIGTSAEFDFVTKGIVPNALPGGQAGRISDPAVHLAVRAKHHPKKKSLPHSNPETVGWFQVVLSKAEFARIGSTLALDWSNVQRIRFTVKANGNGPAHVWFDALQMGGGVGTEGNYQCAYTFVNTSSGSMSNPSPIATINNVERQGIFWSALQTSADPQVNARALYRSLGNGSLLFFDALINDNSSTTYMDLVSDYIGATDGTTTAFLGNTIIYPIQLQFDNTAPGTLGGAAANWPQVAGPFEGSMFWCGDPNNPGRLYYSPTGRPESVEGWVDISYGNDALQVPFVFHGSLYVLSLSAMYEIQYLQGSDPPLFTYQRVLGAPGINASAPAVVIGKSQFVYQAQEGMVASNGFNTQAVDTGLRVLFRGENAEGIAAFVAKTGAYGKGEFYFSDIGNNTLVMNDDLGTWRNYGMAFSAIAFDKTFATVIATQNASAAPILALDSPGVFADFGSPTSVTTFYWVADHFSGTAKLTKYPVGANGAATPTATITGAATLLNLPAGLFTDATKLWVANGTGSGTGGSVLAFMQTDNGNVAPTNNIGGAATGINSPFDVAQDVSGNIYVANSGNGSITVYAPNSTGNVAPFATISGGLTTLSIPQSVAIDSAGFIYVVDQTNRLNIRVFAPGANGNVAPDHTFNVTNDGLSAPNMVRIGPSNVIWIARTSGNGRVQQYAAGVTGSPSPVIDMTHANLSGGSHGVALDSTGNVYVANLQNQQINVFAPGSTGTTAPTLTVTGVTGAWGIAMVPGLTIGAPLSIPIPIEWQPVDNLIGEDMQGVVRRIVFDINTVGQTLQTFLIYNDADTLPQWSNTTAAAVALGYTILDANGNIQKVTTAGITGATAPVWATTLGGTTTDNTAVWTLQAAGQTALGALSTAFRQRVEYTVAVECETLACRLTGNLSTGIVELFAILVSVEAGGASSGAGEGP
jgi:hypothetical protein